MRVLTSVEISAVNGGAGSGLGFDAITKFFANVFAAVVNLPMLFIDPFYYLGSLGAL